MSDGGVKYDSGKPLIFSGVVDYFPRALAMVAHVSEFGATKYAWKGWEKVENGTVRYRDALMRHLVESTITEQDNDSSLPHLAHVAWNALTILELHLREKTDAVA